MVGDYVWFVYIGEEMYQVYEWLGEVVVDYVCFCCQFVELFEYVQGKFGGSELQVEFGVMYYMFVEGYDRWMWIVVQGQDVVVDFLCFVVFVKLEDYLFDFVYCFVQVGFVEVQYLYLVFYGMMIGCSGEICVMFLGKLFCLLQVGFLVVFLVDGIFGYVDQYVRQFIGIIWVNIVVCFVGYFWYCGELCE